MKHPLELLNDACKNKNFPDMLMICQQYSMKEMGLFLCDIIQQHRVDHKQDDLQEIIASFHQMKTKLKLKLLPSWTSSSELSKIWNKLLTPDLIFVDDSPDYYVILNHPPPGAFFIKEKTIVFHMEPFMDSFPPDPEHYFKIVRHETELNNIEWHLSWTRQELLTQPIEKFFETEISAVLSRKYQDVGQRLRIDFVKALERDISVHVFGEDMEWKDYRGALPYHEKDFGLFPYKYHVAAENNAIPNYVTEKLIDGILSECLVFYWGCPNVSDYIDPRAYIQLNLEHMEEDIKIVKEAITNGEWEKRLEYIRTEKQKILNELSFAPRLLTILDKN